MLYICVLEVEEKSARFSRIGMGFWHDLEKIVNALHF